MALAVPCRLIVCTVLKNPLSLMLMVPVRVPEAVGTKYTFIVQVAPLASDDGQLSASLKSPVVVMLLMVNGPNALIVTGCGELVVPTLCKPNNRLDVVLFSALNAVMPRIRQLYWSATV